MKKIILFILILSFEAKSIDWSQWQFERLQVNLIGAVANDNVILTYGDGAIVMRSTDIGKTWAQQAVAKDELFVKKIINNNNNFYGILDKDYLIKSTNNGITWEKKYFPNSSFIDICNDEENVYILVENRIFVYDYDFNLLASIFMSPNQIPLAMEVNNNYIIIPIGGNEMMFINKTNFVEKEVKNVDICFDCKPRNLRVSDNIIYFLSATTIYKSSNNGDNWESLSGGYQYIDVFKSKIYDIRPSLNLETQIGMHLFGRVNESTNEFEQISKDTAVRMMPKFYLNNSMKVLNDSLVIAVGKDKLITISTNGGVDWDISCYNPLSVVNVNYKTGFFTNFNSNTHTGIQILSSSNNGITWTPNIYQDPNNLLLKDNLPLIIEYDTITGFGFGYCKKFYTNDSLNLFYTNDFKKSWKFAHWGKNLNGVGITSKHFNLDNATNGINFLISVDNLDYYVTRIYNIDTNANVTLVKQIDSLSIMEIDFSNPDQYRAIGVYTPFPEKIGAYVSHSVCYVTSSDGFNWKREFEFDTLWQSIDLSIKGTSDYKILGKYCIYYYKTVYFDLDTKTFSTNCEVNVLDIEKQKLYKNVIPGDTLDKDVRLLYNGELILSTTNNYYYTNPNFDEDPYNWQKDSSFHNEFNGYIYWIQHINENEIYLTIRRGNSLINGKLTPKSHTSVENEIEIPTQMYVNKPYPLPAIM